MTYACTCTAVGPRGGSVIMNSEWEHLLFCGIAQYDLTPDASYPFIETQFNLEIPFLEDSHIQEAIGGKEGKWRWFPFLLRFPLFQKQIVNA